jgi:hypothetical protein
VVGPHGRVRDDDVGRFEVRLVVAAEAQFDVRVGERRHGLWQLVRLAQIGAEHSRTAAQEILRRADAAAEAAEAHHDRAAIREARR